jgi:GT2 family glycosyltransferase
VPGRPTVAICALTFDRPVGLDAMLAGLAALEVADVDVRVVIVDNDTSGGARATVESWRERMPWELRYEVEPMRGIPFGRNRAVRSAGAVDHIAFLDDDEVPEPGWLAELLRVQHLTGADVVTGTVLPRYEVPPPRWVLDGRFFERRRYVTGAELEYARTSNVLIAAHVFPAGDEAPFNERMALSGGEDTHFFMRARQAGHRIVWADEAVVTEEVPTSRVNTRWLLRRSYRMGNTLSLCLRDLADSPARRVRRAVNGIWKIVSGLLQVALAIGRGRAALVLALQRITYGAGLLSGLVGVRFEEYRTTHGR